MRILIAEDDLVSRKMLSKFLSSYGQCDITVDGMEALEAFMLAWDEEDPYDLICLDIMMPELDGLRTLKTIRDLEREKDVEDNKRVKIIMTTALDNVGTVQEAFETGSEAYAAKPLDLAKLEDVMKRLNLI